MHRSVRSHRRVAAKVSILLLAASALGGCAGDPPREQASASENDEGKSVTVIEIEAYDFGFSSTPEAVPAGPIETILTNVGEQPHQALIYRLNDGVSFDDFKNKIMSDDSLVPQLAKGGTDGVSQVIGTGKEAKTVGDELAPGHYAILCFVRDQSLKSDKNHVELGMVSPLTVE